MYPRLPNPGALEHRAMVLVARTKWPWFGLVITMGMTLIGGACRSTQSPPAHEAHYAVSVPFIAQRGTDDCGATALAMLMRFHGDEPDEDRLRDELTIPALGGTIPALLVAVAQAAGYDTTLRQHDPDAMLKAMQDGTPIIVLLAPTGNTTVGHFIVVTGRTQDGKHIRAHDGPHRDRWMDANSLTRRWRQTNYLTIAITPQPRSLSDAP